MPPAPCPATHPAPQHRRPARRRRRLLTGVLAVALAGSPLLGTGLAAGDEGDAPPVENGKRVNQAWSVPSSASVTVNGRGFGHGHGMSQYGAQGAAERGRTHKQILDFYYPGTTWGKETGSLRVLLTAASGTDTVVAADWRQVLRDTGTGTTWKLPRSGTVGSGDDATTKAISRWRLTTSGSRSVVHYLLDGRWRYFRALKGDGEVSAGAGGVLALQTAAGTRKYRGWLRAARPATSSSDRSTVNVLPMDSYLRGVVPLEIPASWNKYAVRAQAVAARTYAAYERDHPRASWYDICDTTSCQVYGGYGAEAAASNQAVKDTAGQALQHDGGPAFTQFGSSSGGWTSAGSVSYLPAKEDPYDDWAGNPVHEWSWTTTDTDLERTWPRIGNLSKIAVSTRDGNGTWGGRVSSLTLTGSRGSVTVSGDAFRSALGLRSSWFSFSVRAR